MRRFEVEARAMSRLQHPNCVGVIDFGLDQGAPYLVLDFITGRTLRQHGPVVLHERGRLAHRVDDRGLDRRWQGSDPRTELIDLFNR